MKRNDWKMEFERWILSPLLSPLLSRGRGRLLMLLMPANYWRRWDCVACTTLSSVRDALEKNLRFRNNYARGTASLLGRLLQLGGWCVETVASPMDQSCCRWSCGGRSNRRCGCWCRGECSHETLGGQRCTSPKLWEREKLHWQTSYLYSYPMFQKSLIA